MAEDPTGLVFPLRHSIFQGFVRESGHLSTTSPAAPTKSGGVRNFELPAKGATLRYDR